MVRSLLAVTALASLASTAPALTRTFARHPSRPSSAPAAKPHAALPLDPVALTPCPNGRGRFIRCAGPSALPRAWAITA